MRIPITGMSCQGCAQTIQESVRKLPGAKNVHVNFALKELHFDGVEVIDVIRTLRDLGYDSPGAGEGLFKVPEVESMGLQETRAAFREFLMAAVLGIPEFFLGMGWFGLHGPPWLEAILATAVVLGAGFDIHKRAFKQLTKRQLTMDTLVSMGSGAALLESYLFWFRGSGHAGFEAASTIVLFILLGRYLEARARRRTFSATAELFKAFQQPVIRITDHGEEKVIGLDLQVADRISLRPGEISPVDGIVLEGLAQMDESSITGEPLPRQVKQGDLVISGTVVVDSPLILLVKRTGAESFLGRLLIELEKAESQPVELQRLADKVTAVFVPAVIMTASLAALAHFFLQDNPELAFKVFLSVLLVACPCALGLAIPTALVAGLGASARRGVLFRDAGVLEASAKIRHLYFDKTGTLTRGAPQLIRLETLGEHSENDIVAWASSVERGSLHPLAKAFLEAAAARGVSVPPALKVKSVAGMGIEGYVGGKNVRIMRSGRSEQGGDQGRGAETQSEIYVDEKLAARASFADELRPETLPTLEKLKSLNMRLHLLTGDHRGAVEKLKLDRIFDSVETELLPEDKKLRIEKARRANPAEVAFVGDGINDVLALSAATVGFAVASGTPAALGAGSVSLSRGIRDLPEAFTMAWITQRQLKINLFWAFAYNAVMLPWAVSGRLSPMWAALAMSASSVSVVTGSLFLSFRLRKVAA